MKYFLVSALLALALWPLSSGALTVESGQTLLTDSTKTYTDVFAAGGGTVDLSATYEDDVVVGGGTVTISGPVKGDVLVGGGTVKITSAISGSIRAAGGTVEIDGSVSRNILVAGGTVILGPKAIVAGETTIMGGTIAIEGEIMKDVNIWGGNVVINGAAKKNISIRTADDCRDMACVTIGPKATISGDLTYWAATGADIRSGATVSGHITHHPVRMIVDRRVAEEVFTGFRLWSFLASLVVGLFISLLMPRFVRSVAERMTTAPSRSLWLGVAVLFGAPLACIILMATLIGIPLALILLAAYAIDLFILNVFLGYFLGRVVLDRFWPKGADQPSRVVWATVVGMFLLTAVFTMVLGGSPWRNASWFLGLIVGLVHFALMVWTLGALITVKFRFAKEMGGK